MNKGQKRVLQMLRRVQDFLDELAISSPPKKYLEQRESLDDAVERLEAHAVRQDLGGRKSMGDTRRGKALRRLLLSKQMRPIARIAEAQAVPGFNTDLRMPEERIDIEALVSAAVAMKKMAESSKQVFLDSGLPEDFLERLQETADAIKATLDRRAQVVIDVQGATAGIKQDIATARLAVKQLHSIVIPMVEDNGDKLARWKAARRIGGWPTGATVPAATEAQLAA